MFLYAALMVSAMMVTFTHAQQAPTPTLNLNPNVRELLMPEHSTKEVECWVRAGKNAHLDWKFGRNSEPLPTGVITSSKAVPHSATEFSVYSILTFQNFDPANQVGTYSCIYAKGTNDELSVPLIVSSVKENKIVPPTYYYGNKTTVMGCSLEFTSNTRSATFKGWLKDNKKLDTDDKRFTVHSNGTLEISKLTRDDAGEYKAEFNVSNMANTSFCHIEFKAGPLVLDMAKSENLIEGEDLSLKCEVRGYPQPTISWHKDGKPINLNDKRLKLQAHEGYENAHLTIEDVKDSDKGRYECQAESVEFNTTVSKSILVRVGDKLAWLWPLLGILAQVIVLAVIIFVCEKFKSKSPSSPSD